MKLASLALSLSVCLVACGSAFTDDEEIDIGASSQPLSGALAYRGVNLCGAEFGIDAYGNGAIPGTFGTNYTYPDPTYVSSYTGADYFIGKGATTFRLPFRWERLQPTRNAAFDGAELTRLRTTVNHLLAKGTAVILDPQNFARYGTATIGSSTVPNSHFADFWTRLANEFKGSPNVLFNLVNEPHDIGTEQWVSAANAAIAGIRGAGATNLILVPGNGWTGAHSWSSNYYGTANSVAMLNIVDPGNNYAYEVHQYLDPDSGGGGSECVSRTIGSERLDNFTRWLRANGKRGFLGEIGGPATSTCVAAIDDALKHLEANSDVYLGWTYWAGGPWWSSGYALSVEPSGGTDRMQMQALVPHFRWASTQTQTQIPTSTGCTTGTYEAESMTKTTGGATSGGWNIWSNGSVYTTRDFTAGSTTLTVYAAGQAAGGVSPHMVVSVGGTTIGSANVTSTSYAAYSFTFDATAGTKEIRVTFDNDGIVGTEDRNLLVDKVVVGCPSTATPPPPPPTPACTAQSFEAETMTHSVGASTSGGWNLYSSGYVSTNASFDTTSTTIVVSAGGTYGKGWPHFVVTVGGATVGSATVTTGTFSDYAFTFTPSSTGTKEIRVTYDNDFSSGKADRNLYVDKVAVRCP